MNNLSILTFTINQLELLHDFYARPISNSVPAIQEVNENNTVVKPEKDRVPYSSTNQIYQNIQKESPREKIWTIPFLSERLKSKEFQPPDLEMGFIN